MSKPKCVKRWMLCKEIGFGKYHMIDPGAIYNNLKDAKKHVLECHRDSNHVFIVKIYSVEAG